MGAELALDIDVRISDELRALFRQVRGLPPEPVTPEPEAPKAPEALPQEPEWHRIALRQDGARPLIFDGLPLYSLKQEVGDLPGRADLRIGLYLSDARVLHAALSVLPPETLAARPIHRAAAVTDAWTFARLLRDFAPESCLETLHAAGPEQIAQQDFARRALRTAFTSMAARCLAPDLRPEQGK